MLAHPRRTLILDLHRVQGADSTALSSFAKLARVTGGSSCRLILSEVPSRLRTGLQEELAGYDCRMLPDLDHALEVAEDLLLEDLEQAGPTCRDVFGPHLWSRLEPHLERREAEVGEVIIEHGDNEVALLAIEGGQVVTEIPAGGGWRRVRISGAGTVVGEMSLYRPGGRSARVRVAAPTVLYRLGGRAVAELERSEPQTAAELHRVLARLMAERVALSNEAIRSLLA